MLGTARMAALQAKEVEKQVAVGLQSPKSRKGIYEAGRIARLRAWRICDWCSSSLDGIQHLSTLPKLLHMVVTSPSCRFFMRLPAYVMTFYT
jgi:hypothetical protein